MNRHLDSGAHVAELMAVDKSTLPADGGERFNRLIFARSPYLLQHAENPVDWYEWGDEAFAKARSENLPLLLSIGYATCHWCHVMAHESFGDDEVAQLLNRDYVCIKVDREERPDIDDFYMTVSQVLTGSGGWPLNIFMTPDKRPFFAMTYLPKRGRQGMSGFMDLLDNIATLWHDHPERIEKNCAGIMEALGHLASAGQEELTDLEEISRTAMKQLTGSFDREYGGFGSAPKFPMPINLEWLIDQGNRGHREGMALALQTLHSIREGGIWDQLGGGIHRYSVDREWLVPHFEKMLYDQAMLARAAAEAFQTTGDLFYREMVLNIFDFVNRELTSPDGGFYCALDADSEGVEGKYYVWDKREIVALLGPEAELFCSFYDITDRGNFEGHSIPNIAVPLEEFCHQEGLDLRETGKILEQCRRRLLERREQRVRPLRDEKIITAWNGLMIAALARGGAILNQPEAVQSAARAAEFILGELRRPDGRLLRSHLNGPSPVPGFLEDYAFLCHGLIELYEATLEPIWQSRALDLTEEMVRLFHDPDSQRFFKVGKDAEQMPAQASLEHDGVMPSSFSLTSRCFVRLGHILERPELLDLAYEVLSGLQSDARRHPTAYLGCLQSWDLLENEPVLVTLHGERLAPPFRELLMAARSLPVPRLMLRHGVLAGETKAELCAEGACRPPVTSPSQLRRQLEELHGVKG